MLLVRRMWCIYSSNVKSYECVGTNHILEKNKNMFVEPGMQLYIFFDKKKLAIIYSFIQWHLINHITKATALLGDITIVNLYESILLIWSIYNLKFWELIRALCASSHKHKYSYSYFGKTVFLMTHLSNKFTKNTKKVVVGSCCLVRRQTLSVF